VAWLPRWQNLENPQEENLFAAILFILTADVADFRIITTKLKDLGVSLSVKLSAVIRRPSASISKRPRNEATPITWILIQP
jgi:hypothetical protein